jgi:adenylate cyclase
MIVIFADISGFTALAETHGDGVAARIVADVTAMIRRIAATAGLRLVKTMGDGFLLTAPDAATAVTGVGAVLRELDERDSYPALHVGMHAGEVIEQDGDLIGRTVNLAARVAAAAGPDEVLMTQDVACAAGSTDTRLVRVGRRRLRNVSRAVELWMLDGVRRQRATDPVCRMKVDPSTALSDSSCGRRNYFCSEHCRSTFLASPRKFSLPRGGLVGRLKEVLS